MSRKKYSASRRLLQFALEEKNPKQSNSCQHYLRKVVLVLHPPAPLDPVLAPPLEMTAAVQTAFDLFGFDAQDSVHWHKLLHAFAEAHFGERKLGRRVAWDITQLINDISALPTLPPSRVTLQKALSWWRSSLPQG